MSLLFSFPGEAPCKRLVVYGSLPPKYIIYHDPYSTTKYCPLFNFSQLIYKISLVFSLFSFSYLFSLPLVIFKSWIDCN